MINWLHAQLHRPESGWDPVPADYAERYAKEHWAKFQPRVVDRFEQLLGGFTSRRVLDLGGGPGHYSVEFARRGATVVWHDVSNNYLRIARDKSREFGVPIRFSLGYLEDAVRLAEEPFDFVFCNICWYYCRSDRRFATVVKKLLAPGGIAYIDVTTAAADQELKMRLRVQVKLNNLLGWKVGHPHPPAGRLERLFNRYADLEVECCQPEPGKEQLLIRRAVDY